MKSVPLAICAVAVMLSGCASTRSFVEAQPAGSDASLVHFIRMHYPPTAWTGELVVNGQVVGELKDGSCLRANVPVGKADIDLKFAPMLGFTTESFTIESKPNETRYLLMTGDVNTVGSGLNTIYLRATFNVIELPAQGGDARIEALRKTCV